MNKEVHIGPYARCTKKKNGEPANWITEDFKDEALYYGNGESIEAPALFLPNRSYEGKIKELDQPDYWTGEVAFAINTKEAVAGFEKQFAPEIEILRQHFEKVEIVFGMVVTYR